MTEKFSVPQHQNLEVQNPNQDTGFASAPEASIEPTAEPSTHSPEPRFNERGTINLEFLHSGIDQARLALGGLGRVVLEKRLERIEAKHKKFEQSAEAHKKVAKAMLDRDGHAIPATLGVQRQSRRAARRKKKEILFRGRQYRQQRVWGEDVGTPQYAERVKRELPGIINAWRRWGALDAGDRFNKIQKKAAKKHGQVVRSAEGGDIPGKFIGRRVKKFEKKAENLHEALNNIEERQEHLREKVREQKVSTLDKKADEAVLQAHFHGHVADIMENHTEGHLDSELEVEPQNRKEHRAEKRMIKDYRAIHEYRSRTYKGDEAKMYSDIQKYGTDLPLELAGALEDDVARLRKKREKALKRAEKLREKADSLRESS